MTNSFLGIDVSKKTLDVVLYMQGKYSPCKQFINDAEGHTALYHWLQQKGAMQCHIAMEATGHYGEAIATFLYQKGCMVSVVNPLQIKAVSKMLLTRTKTDAVDARLIAEYCKTRTPSAWKPCSPSARKLRDLYRCTQDLETHKQSCLNHLENDTLCKEVKTVWRERAATAEQRLQVLHKKIQEHIRKDEDLKSKVTLLESIPGVGVTTAVAILGEVVDIEAFDDARQVAAYAGLTPQEKRSGSSVHGRTRLCKRGNASLRKALYFPAIVAMRYNPIIKAFAEKLLAKGKCKMAVIGAVMRKLLHIAYGVLKHRTAFDPAWA
jgi:transposase